MRTYQVGPDPLYQGDFDDLECRGTPGQAYEWVIYWYKNEMYDGSGLLAACRRDTGGVKWKNLGWDSCSVPDREGLYGAPEVPLRKFLTFDEFDEEVSGKRRSPEDLYYERWQAIVKKAKEITQQSASANS